eukprot:8234631-Pyramimonas_sp.AAC.1
MRTACRHGYPSSRGHWHSPSRIPAKTIEFAIQKDSLQTDAIRPSGRRGAKLSPNQHMGLAYHTHHGRPHDEADHGWSRRRRAPR